MNFIVKVAANKPNSLNRIRIVLCCPSHPGNIGASARAMKTMGLGRLYLVKPKFFPHPQAAALAADAENVLQGAQVCACLEDALKGTALVVGLTARKRALSHRLLSLRDAVQKAIRVACDDEIAFVLGREDSGLTNTELDQCQWLVRIPATPRYSSLNLAAAVQVLAYELYLAAGMVKETEVEDFQWVRHEDMEVFYARLEKTLIHVGYLNPKRPGYLMRRLRRLFSRAQLEEGEWNMLMGILKDICKKAD